MSPSFARTVPVGDCTHVVSPPMEDGTCNVGAHKFLCIVVHRFLVAASELFLLHISRWPAIGVQHIRLVCWVELAVAGRSSEGLWTNSLCGN